MNRTPTRRAGAETDIFLMVGCSVSKAAFLFLIFFMALKKTTDRDMKGDMGMLMRRDLGMLLKKSIGN